MNKIVEFERLMRLDIPEPKISVASSPIDLVRWAVDKFSSHRTVLTSAFGMEGCALIDMYAQVTASLTVAYIDTGFYFPETVQLIEKIKQRYSHLNFVCWESPVTIARQAASYGDNLWRDNPNLCCHIRKVVPMKVNIQAYQLWVSALRKTQTKQRNQTSVLQWDWTYQMLKFCPLANWTRGQVWEYVQKHNVPFNQLHLQGYPSIGCVHCTQSVPGSSPADDSRQGRWQGTAKTECGLHYSI